MKVVKEKNIFDIAFKNEATLPNRLEKIVLLVEII